MSATAAVQILCDALEIEIVPTKVKPGPRQTTGPAVIRQLLDKYGKGMLAWCSERSSKARA